jgi:hypothetical protein
LLVAAHLSELPFVHNEDSIGALHSGETVRDEDARAAFNHAIERAADAQLGIRVNA